MGELRQTTVQDGDVAHIFRALSLAALTAFAVYLCWLMTSPFLSAFTWAFAFAVALSPLRTWLSTRLPKLLATLLVITAAIIVAAVPGALFSRQLLCESVRAQQLLRDSIQGGGWQSALADHPRIGEVLAWAGDRLDLGQIGQQLAGAMAGWIAPVVAHSVGAIAQAGVILLALYFFLQDEDIALAAVRAVLPFSSGESDRLIARLSSTVRATVYGRLLIGTIQGSLGGVIFALVGLPAPVFWGAVM